MSLHDQGAKRHVQQDSDDQTETAPQWVRVTADRKCPACRHDGYCYFERFGDGPTRVVCMRVPSDRAAKKEGWYHDADREPAAGEWSSAEKVREDYAAKNVQYVTDLATERDNPAGHLDQQLGLPAGACAAAIAGLGFIFSNTGPHCVTFPEFDGAGMQVGVQRRYLLAPRSPHEKKKNQGSRGMTLPNDFAARAAQGVVYVVEGESDTVAMHAAGLCAIGQPGACSGFEDLTVYLKANAPTAKIIVIAERDAAGRRNGFITAGYLERHGLDAWMCQTPELADSLANPKDARAWLSDVAHDLTTTWPDRGATFAALVTAGAVKPSAAEAAMVAAERANEPTATTKKGTAELTTTLASKIKIKSTKWLVRDRIVLGAAGIVYAPGGYGKTTLLGDLAAAITRGRCAFGATYKNPVRGDVMWVTAEESLASTVVPRLTAADADLDRIHLDLKITTAGRADAGREVTLSKDDIAAIKRYVRAHPAIRLIVIDPIASFVGRTVLENGKHIDDHRSTELRQALDPLNELADEYGLTAMAIAHTNKNAKAGAADRVAGSAAYRDASRFAYAVSKDPEDDDARLFVNTKTNFRVDQTAVVYREELLDDAGKERMWRAASNLDPEDRDDLVERSRRVVYDEPRYVDESQLFAVPKVSAKVQEGLDVALGCLQGSNGPVAVADVVEALTAAGCSKRTIELTKAALVKEGYKPWKDGFAGQMMLSPRPRAHKMPSYRSAPPPPINPLDGM